MEPKRYWSDLSDSYKEELKSLWQSSSEDYQDNYSGFKEWLLDNYNIILDNKDYIKKENKIFWGIMIALICLLIGIFLAIYIIENDSKDKLIEVLENDGYSCNYGSTICNRIDYPKENNMGEYRFNFERNEYGMFFSDNIDNVTTVKISAIYNWKLDTSSYFLGVYVNGNVSSQIVATLNEYGNFTCNGNANDCNNAKLSMEMAKDRFNGYIARADIDKDKLQ